VREALDLNPAGPDEIEGIDVANVEKSDDGYFTHEVILRFESVETLEAATQRLFDQASEMFEYGIHDDAGDVQDFASYALPATHEVTEA